MSAIDDAIKILPNNWLPNPSLKWQPEDILTNEFLRVLPDDFMEYHKKSDGGEGKLGALYLTLWQLKDAEILTKEYGFQKHMHPKIIAIGTTDDAFVAFDFSGKKGEWIAFPFGDFDLNEICKLGDSFSDVLMSLIKNHFLDKARKLLLYQE